MSGVKNWPVGINWPTPEREVVAQAVWAVVDGEEIGFCLNCGLKHKEPVPVDAVGIRCATCDEDCVASAQEIVRRAMGWERRE